MAKNEKTKITPFTGTSRLLKDSDNAQIQTIPIERGDSEKSNASSAEQRRRHFGNGDNNENNFNGDIVNNYGSNAVGGILKGENAVKKSDNTNGCIIYDETGSASNDENSEDFGNGNNNCNNFGGRVVNNYGARPKGKGKGKH